MTGGCIMTNPSTLAIQALTFGRYLIKTFPIELCKEWEVHAERFIGFFVVCRFN